MIFDDGASDSRRRIFVVFQCTNRFASNNLTSFRFVKFFLAYEILELFYRGPIMVFFATENQIPTLLNYWSWVFSPVFSPPRKREKIL